MQQPQNQQANLLSIFSFIFAGIQGLALLFIGLYGLMMLAVLIMGATNSSRSPGGEFIVPFLIFALFAVMAIYGCVSVWLNVKLGRMLRSKVLPTQKRVMVTSIVNLCSFLCGGVLILPFGMAIGIFGIVFAASDSGKAFLNGIPTGQLMPPSPTAYPQASSHQPHTWQ